MMTDDEIKEALTNLAEEMVERSILEIKTHYADMHKGYQETATEHYQRGFAYDCAARLIRSHIEHLDQQSKFRKLPPEPTFTDKPPF